MVGGGVLLAVQSQTIANSFLAQSRWREQQPRRSRGGSRGSCKSITR